MKVKSKTKRVDNKWLIRNKDIYNSFNHILNFNFSFKDLLIIFIFSFIMQTRNKAEIELKKISTEFACKMYSLLLTSIFCVFFISLNITLYNLLFATTLFISINSLIFTHYNFKPDNQFISRLFEVFNEVNITLNIKSFNH